MAMPWIGTGTNPGACAYLRVMGLSPDLDEGFEFCAEGH